MAYATGYGSDIGQSTVDYGLAQAKDLLAPANNSFADYPTYVGNLRNAPVNMAYGVNFTDVPDYTKVAGLGSSAYGDIYGNYAKEAKTAYDRSMVEGDNRYGAGGLYGSQGAGMQSDYLSRAQDAYSQGLMNARTQAYNTMLADNAQQIGQNQFAWKAGTADVANKQAYDQTKFAWDYGREQQARDFANAQLADKYAYDLAKRADASSVASQRLANAIALATGATPTAAAQLNAATSASNAALAASQSGTNALMTGAGGLLGGILGNSSITSGVGNWLSGLFGSSSSGGLGGEGGGYIPGLTSPDYGINLLGGL